MFLRVSLFLAAACVASPAFAAAPDAAAAFGARTGIQSISLSPDGSMIAFLAPTTGKGNGLYVVPVDKHVAPRRIAVASGDPEVLRSCDWVTGTRLVCLLSSAKKAMTGIQSGSRLIAMDSDAKNLKGLTGGLVDMLVGEDKGDILVGYAGHYSSVYRLNTTTLKTKQESDGVIMGTSFLSDAGKVRVAGAVTEDGYYQGRVYKYFYRRKADWKWDILSKYDILDRTGFQPIAVDGTADVAYGLQRQDGRLALVSMALDGTLATKPILSRADVDIDGVVTLGRRQRVIGASFITDRRQTNYFDPELAQLRTNLDKLFPAGSEVDFVGASDDEKKLLVSVSSDTAPGTYYVFDKTTRHLEQMILARPELAAIALAAVKPVQVVARDGTRIPAYLTLPTGGSKNLPTIVMPHGGPEARDELGFDWLAQYFVERGYAVIQPNFRGSDGYGDAWFAKNAYQSWPTAIGDVADSGRWAVSEGIADPARLYILGWSYGGYAALQSAVVAPGLFKAVVAIAPVTDLETLKKESADYYNRFLEASRIGSGPLIAAGSPARHAADFTSPVLMFHGDIDENVGIRESRLMDEKLRAAGKSSRLVVYPGLDHQLDDATARADMLRQADAFMKAAGK